MNTPINWIDECYVSSTRTVLTFQEFQIPGLKTFGKHTMTNAIAPLPLHFHENCFEITYVTKGSSILSTNNAQYKVTGGDIFLTTPNEVHSTDEIPLSLGEIYWLQLDVSNVQDFLFLSEEGASCLISSLSSIQQHVIETDNKKTKSLLKEIFYLLQSPLNRYNAAAKLTVFLHHLIQCSKETQFQLTPDIGKSVEYVLDHVEQEISLDFLGSCSNLSTSQFKQKFKNQMGISPRTFINQQKIEISKPMLLNNTPITEIAMELGFNSSSYFSVVFKRYTFCSPSEYIKQQESLYLSN